MNKIGLDIEKSNALATSLNDLLANYAIFYQNVRGYHWRVKGEKFFELHVKFEELYNDLFVKIDEIAERILTLGAEPNHNYSSYLNFAKIQESHNVEDGISNVEQIVEAFGILIAKQRDILLEAGDTNDEGTMALMSDYIREQEKLIWMYSAFLG